MINFIIWIIVGALIGWLASVIMGTNDRQGLLSDIFVGIVGSFVGGYFLGPILDVGTINDGNFSVPALLVTLGGAIILLGISRLLSSIGGLMAILIIVLVIYVYFSCWILTSTSVFCAVRTLPFLQ
jgi:uncharacterized membrane protein YeaQ/YmgE (transglycosylase-associated protein family)